MKSTISSSSRIVTEASDFFMDENVGHFMHHSDVIAYLRAYIEHFNLGAYLRFNCDVESVRKSDNKWFVSYQQDGESKQILSDKLAICAGLHNKKKTISTPISDFSGSIIHAGDLKAIQPGDFTAEDRILVYGGGETASDIVDLLVKTPAKITWAIRGGQHFLRKTPFHQRSGVGEFSQHDFALDLIASPVINALSPFSKGAPGRRYLTDFLSTGSFGGYQGHGIPQWRNEYRYAQTFFNKNGHTVEYAKSGRISPQNEVVSVRDSEVEFKSGEQEKFTHIICCFGYEFHCPFLPAPLDQGELQDFYQYVFPTEDPSVAFLGFARPIIGSIPLLTEMQCLWTFRVWSNKAKLPDQKQMQSHQVNINARWDRRLPGRGNLRTLVLPSTYVAMMLKSAYPGRRPGEHFKKKPTRPLKFLSWIPSGSMRLALDPDLSDDAFHQLWRKRKHGVFLAWLLPIVIVLSRLSRIESVVDWVVNWRDKRRQKNVKKLIGDAVANPIAKESRAELRRAA